MSSGGHVQYDDYRADRKPLDYKTFGTPDGKIGRFSRRTSDSTTSMDVFVSSLPELPFTKKKESKDRLCEANGILEKCIMTSSDRANAMAPDINYLRRNYTICEKYFDESDWSYERDHPNLVGMCISTVLTEEMMIVPDEINITLKNHKYLFRAKIKSDASKSSTAAKGATNTSISLAEAQKKIAKLLTTRTIIASFDPTLHMHLLNIVHYRLIDVRMLFYKDHELGLKTDRESLIRRYLGDEWLQRPDAFSAIALALNFFGSFNWKQNVALKKNLPIVPMHLDVKQFDQERTSNASRQELIKQAHAELAWKYRDRYTQAYLLGTNVIRVHIKKLDQLRAIGDLVTRLPMLLKQRMERNGSPKKCLREYGFILISLPKSTQATRLRGFFMYLQYRDNDMALAAQKIFQDPYLNSGNVKYKCESAVPKTKPVTGLAK